eukprot:TRINITY_DN7901_c0_g1_i1.p1 TRINITY_DN7901_c0_g1~~TRINITY_DN7901_c0_g1_i1.p1  ORF type:complete len:733 (+),score=167.78 TRINITY_DN7901_c0_g1_i1:639-2837(+)
MSEEALSATESHSHVDTASPGSVGDQVKQFNKFFNKNPERFPSKHPSQVRLPELKAAAAAFAAGEQSGTSEGGASIADLTSEKSQALSGMAIGVVPKSTSSSHTSSSSGANFMGNGHVPPGGSSAGRLGTDGSSLGGANGGGRASQYGSIGQSERISAASDEADSAAVTPAPDLTPSGKSTFVALHVKFFESPANPSTPSPVEGAQMRRAAEDEDSPGLAGEQLNAKGDEGIPGFKRNRSANGSPAEALASPKAGAVTQSPLALGRSRSSSMPRSISSSSGSGRPNHTIPEPFSLATDRRGGLIRSTSSVQAPASVPKKAGVVRASFESPQVPPKPVPRPTTSPEPFNLESVKRHEEAVERLKAERLAREKEEEERRKFKANPIAQSSPPPVLKSTPPTEGLVFKLASQERAEKRKEFSQKVEQKSTEKLYEQQTSLEQAKLEVEEQIKEYRKSLIFKATPMPGFYGQAPAKSRDRNGSGSEDPAASAEAASAATPSPRRPIRLRSAGAAPVAVAFARKASPASPQPSRTSTPSPSAKLRTTPSSSSLASPRRTTLASSSTSTNTTPPARPNSRLLSNGKSYSAPAKSNAASAATSSINSRPKGKGRSSLAGAAVKPLEGEGQGAAASLAPSRRPARTAVTPVKRASGTPMKKSLAASVREANPTNESAASLASATLENGPQVASENGQLEDVIGAANSELPLFVNAETELASEVDSLPSGGALRGNSAAGT